MQEPFTSLLLKLQSGKFDHPGRTFFSIPQAWEGVMRSTSDLKVRPRSHTTHTEQCNPLTGPQTASSQELIPEFFYLPEFLENSNGFDFGEIDGTKINDVRGPRMDSSPRGR